MKKLVALLLCLSLCLPMASLGEDFLVGSASSSGSSAAFQAALDSLNEGSLLDAINAFAGIGLQNDANRYADYAHALLYMQRDNPVEAKKLLADLSGFLDSDYQLALAEAMQLHRFAQDDQFGYVGSDGKWQIAPQFDWAERVFRGESLPSHNRDTTAFTAEDLYRVAAVFMGTTAIDGTDVQPLDGKYGLIRSDGTLVVPVIYTEILWTVNGVAAVTDGESCYLYNLITAKRIGNAYEEIGVYENGYITVKLDGLWGYLDPITGDYLGDGCVWETALPFSDGYAGVSLDGDYGFIDESGSIAIDLQYTGVASFSEGLAGVRISKRWGFINPQNELVIKQAYAAVQTFQYGACAVKKSSSWGLINTEGNVILRIKYSEITDFDPIYHRAWIRQNKLWGLIATDGTIISKPTWSIRDDFNSNTLCRVAYKNKYGFIDANGKLRIINSYTAASPFCASYAAVVDSEGNITYINKTMRSFTIDTDVPVECRCGFIEGRKFITTEQTVITEDGETQALTETHMQYALYDQIGTPIPVVEYTAQ